MNYKWNDFSILFDGNDDYVDCGVISAFQSTANFSVSFWLKVPNFTASNFIFGTFTNTTDTIYAFVGTSGNILFNVTNFTRAQSSANTIVAGQWRKPLEFQEIRIKFKIA